ncbi:MAG: hypothetical protein HYV09_00745 [Deltaproteobacteria bacterium]|nr:hypothetical protein [Deltaproteobacteria bacterium]
MMRRWLSCALLIASAAGCGDSGEGLGGRPNSGLIGGSGTARPECGALAQGCMGQGLDAPIALGSTLEIALDYQIGGSSGPPTEIESANPLVLKSEGKGRVTATGEGISALMFAAPDGAVIDFLHVWVAAPDELRVVRYGDEGNLLGRVQDEVKLLVGDELLVAVETYGKGQALLGNFLLEYEVTGADVAVVPDAVDGLYRVVARTAGASTITFKALGLNRAIAIEVLP